MGADGGLGRVLHEPKVTTEPPEQPVATGKNRPKAGIHVMQLSTQGCP